MDAARFDALAKSLTDAHSRRGALGGLLAGALGLLGVRSHEAEAHNPVKKCKKKSGDAKKKCIKKAKQHNAQHAAEAFSPPPPPPPPVCPVDRTCAGTCCPVGQVCDAQQRCCTENVAAICTQLDAQCGEYPGPCGRPISCGTCGPCQVCNAGGCTRHTRLANGSCANPCTSNGDCPGCAGGCTIANTEGARYCLAQLIGGTNPCGTPACTRTADCPVGKQCQETRDLDCPTRTACYPLC